MREKKQWRNIKKLLCLFLTVILICSAVPVKSILAVESETAQEVGETTEAAEQASDSETGGENATAHESDSALEPSDEMSEGTEAELEESGETEQPENMEQVADTNSISGMLWLDMFYDIDNSIYAGDAIRQAAERPLAGYTVSLYKADDTENAAQTTITDAGGKYEFVNLEPDTYVVGVATTTIDEIEYLLPFWYLDGTEGDNRFVTTYDAEADAYLNAYTDLIIVEADSVIEDMDAGMRIPPGIQLLAGPYDAEINLATGIITGDSTGITVTASLITFATGTNGKNYRLYGTTTARTILVSASVTTMIALDGVSITSATTSPLRLVGTANVTLNLADGTDNELICTSITTDVNNVGIEVPYVSAANYSTLTIEGTTGKLTAKGGTYGTGIGGSYSHSSTGGAGGTITINGGIVTATGGTYGAGIGGGGTYSGGTGGAGGTITINGGTVTATGGTGAGIGGGFGKSTTGFGTGGAGGTITINGGTVSATGNSGAGIGGGYGDSSANGTGGAGGTITINGGTVSATGNGSRGAGIGGGYGFSYSNGIGGAGETITITGGTVSATGSAGIGGGYGSSTGGGGGTVTISGGTVSATSSASGAGIGGSYGGSVGGGGGTVTISGGTVSATSSGNGAGIGGGYATTTRVTTGTNVFTSGSIYPTNSSGVSVATSTRNGSLNGNILVYMTAVTVKDIDGNPVPNALVTIQNNLNSSYAYTADTNADGKAYIWVPVRSNVLFEAEDNVLGYGSKTNNVAANNNNAVTIVLGMRTTVDRTPDHIVFKTTADPTPVTLNVTAENTATVAPGEIIGAEWFRVETSDTTVYDKSNFNTACSAASLSGDGGVLTGTDVSIIDRLKMEYALPVSENGTYWVMTHYKDGSGTDVYQVKSIVIDNIYTQVTGKWKGINTIDSSTIYDEDLPDSLMSGLVGVAFELNSTTNILYSTGDGTTTESGTDAQISVTAKSLGSAWTVTSTTPLTANVTGTDIGTFEFQYSLDPSAITIKFDPQGGTPATIANQYYLPADNFILPLPTVSQANHIFDGWFDAATGGTQVNPTATDTVGSLFPSASGGVVTLYAHWTPTTRTVTEKYVDQDGNQLTDNIGTPIPDTTQTVNPGNNYDYNGAGTVPAIQDYIFIGYKVGSDTDTFTSAPDENYDGSDPEITNVTAHHTVFLIYTKPSITIQKFKDNGTDQLPGVVFKLEKLDSGGSVDSSFVTLTGTTDSNGEYIFEGDTLKKGDYQITEVSAPSGFSTLKEPIAVELPYKSTATPTGSYTYKTSVGGTDTYYYYNITYKVTDQAELAMPVAGSGFLSQYYIWIGMGIVLAAGSSFTFRQRRRRLQEK